MRMRQSLAQLERAFVEEIEQDRDSGESGLRREAAARAARASSWSAAHKQRLDALRRARVSSSSRTAVLVTVAMFETLYS